MVNDWADFKLSEVINLIGGGTPKRSIAEYWGGDIPWLSVKDFNNEYRHVEKSDETITKLGLEKSSTKLLERGQIIISARGTVGELAQVSKTMAFNQSCYGIDAKTEYTLNDFLYYLLKHSISNIQRITHGAVFDTITRDTFNFIEVSLPPLTEQKAIAHILGSLDDKIELNRQMNETLEAMAQALFKSWFVDFDPVIDNALAAGNAIPDEFAERVEQRKGIEKKDNTDIQSLFPDEFEFTEEMGWIPKGWGVTTLEDLAVISSSKRIFAKEYKTEGIPFFRGKEISLLSKGDNVTSDIFISKERFFELKDKFGAPSAGDLLLTSVGTIGNVYLVQEGDEFYFKDGNLTWFSKYKTEIKGGYLSTWFKTRQAYLAIENIKIGSTQQAITISSLNGIKIVKPENNIISLFNSFSENAVKKVSLLNKERQTLSGLRDTLLPKLMSGELRIPDAEALVDEVL